MKFFKKMIKTIVITGLITQAAPVRADWMSTFTKIWANTSVLSENLISTSLDLARQTKNNMSHNITPHIISSAFMAIGAVWMIKNIARAWRDDFYEKKCAVPPALFTPAEEEQYGSNQQVIALLKMYGPDGFYGDRESRITLLHIASMYGDTQLVQMLLRDGVNIRAGNGRSALAYALAYGHFEVVKLLLDAGDQSDDGTSLLTPEASEKCKNSARELLRNVRDNKSNHAIRLDYNCLFRAKYYYSRGNVEINDLVNVVARLLEQGVNIYIDTKFKYDKKAINLLILCEQIPATVGELAAALGDPAAKEQALKVMKARVARKGKDATLDDAQLLARLGDKTLLESQQFNLNRAQGMRASKMPTDLKKEIYGFAGWMTPKKQKSVEKEKEAQERKEAKASETVQTPVFSAREQVKEKIAGLKEQAEQKKFTQEEKDDILAKAVAERLNSQDKREAARAATQP